MNQTLRCPFSGHITCHQAYTICRMLVEIATNFSWKVESLSLIFFSILKARIASVGIWTSPKGRTLCKLSWQFCAQIEIMSGHCWVVLRKNVNDVQIDDKVDIFEQWTWTVMPFISIFQKQLISWMRKAGYAPLKDHGGSSSESTTSMAVSEATAETELSAPASGSNPEMSDSPRLPLKPVEPKTEEKKAKKTPLKNKVRCSSKLRHSSIFLAYCLLIVIKQRRNLRAGSWMNRVTGIHTDIQV